MDGDKRNFAIQGLAKSRWTTVLPNLTGISRFMGAHRWEGGGYIGTSHPLGLFWIKYKLKTKEYEPTY
jgi:hypothetical protein